ncbi:mechanosensitive ion channel family protein [Halococcoides cellulosivorans]|uniref:Mechanosensitive ion channel protein n=1 Tax=Halococcoides cellulosivorans TaxID=1679096 RepID=A0A2R4X322_9EURY|nr:mechanosensitive ion channel domain-containing protein [Halococcoides cellulosivorans]AWB28209.1 mechanosensitive ion channel protein [Halococcoides cellulosivorans]
MAVGPDLVTQFEPLLDQYSEWLRTAGIFLGTFVGTYLLGRIVLVPPVVRAVASRNPDNETLVGAIGLYLRVAIAILAVPIAVTAAGFGGVAVGSSVILAAATLAFGIAGQDVIGNFVSGIFLVTDPDFNVGDYVEWDEECAGTIDRISLRVTRMRTPSGEVIVVPNTELATAAVRHPYAQDRYRISQRLVVGYGDDIASVRALLVEEAAADERVLAEPAPVANVTDLGPSAIELTVLFWVGDPKDRNIGDVRTAFATRAKERLLAEGVDLAPTGTQELSGELGISERSG